MNFNHDTGSITSILTIDTTVAPPLGGSNTLQVVGTGGIAFPSGNTAARPVGVPAGTMRWNSETNTMETFNGTVWVVDGGGTVTSVTVASSTSGLTVTNPTVTSAGTINLALSGELQNFSQINPLADGPVVRLTDGTYVARDFVAAAGSAVIIANGDGVAGNPTFSLDPLLENVADVTTTGFLFVDGTGNTAVTKTFAAAGDITLTETGGVLTFGYTPSGALAGLDAVAGNGIIVQTAEDTYANRAVEGTSGNIVVTNGDGVAGNPVVNLAAVTQAASGNFVKVTLDGFGRVTGNTAVTTADVTALVDGTYVNVAGDTMTGGLAMGGNTITGVAAPVGGTDAVNKNYVDSLVAGLSWKQAVRAATTADVTLASTTTVDGVSLVTGDRVLVRAQTTAAENGIYEFNGTGLVRSADMNDAVEFAGATVFVREGTTLADTGWTQTAEVTTIGTSAVSFTQFTGAGAFNAGIGLSLTGNTFNVNLGAGIAQLPADEVGIDIRANSALFLTEDGSTASTATAAALALRTGAGLTQNSTNGIFIDTGAITNAMLANSTITVTGTSGTDAVALGESLAIVGGSAPITTAVDAGTNSVTISVADATTTTKGLASFNTSHFAVSAGAVSLAATLGDLTNVAPTVDSANTGDVLQFNGTAWTTIAQSALVPALALDGLTDVVITGATTGQFLRYNGTNWVNQTVSVQEADAGLTSLAQMTSTGIVVASAADTFVTRSLVAGTGISITNEAGIAGDITITNTGVTSVGLVLPSIFTVTGSPVTTTGDLTATLASQAAGTVFAAPAGAAGAPTFRALAYSDLPIKLYAENRASEVAPTATGANAVAVGSAAEATRVGEFSHASGQFAAVGDAQSIEMVLRNSTADATVTDLFADGSAARAVLQDNSAWTFTVQVIGTTAGGAQIAGYRFDGVAKRGAGAATVAFAGTPSKNILGENVAAWDAAVVADTTNGALAVRVTGAAATTIRWVATVRATQVKF